MEKTVPSANTIATLGASLFSSPSLRPKSTDNPGTYTLIARPDFRSSHAQQVAMLSDALAALCVAKPGAENKAALCLWIRASGVEVCVAGAKGSQVGEDVQQHMRAIFACLADVSRRAYEVGAREVDDRKLRAVMEEPVRALTRMVYGFAWDKFKARLESGWDAFDEFVKEVTANVPVLIRRGMSMSLGRMIQGTPGVAHFQALEDVHRNLMLCRNDVLRGAELLNTMEWTYHLASTLVDEYRLDDGGTWVPANDIAYLVNQRDPYPLRRFIHKATLLTRAVDTLLTFAFSPRNRPFFTLPLQITPLPPILTETNITSSKTPWSTLLTTLLNTHAPPQPHRGSPTKFSKSALTKLVSALEKQHPHGKKYTVNTPVPAELRIAMHMYPLLMARHTSPSTSTSRSGTPTTKRAPHFHHTVYIGLPTAPSTPSTIVLKTLSSLRINRTHTTIRFTHRPRSKTGKWPAPEHWILPSHDALDLGLHDAEDTKKVVSAVLDKVGDRMSKALVREMWRRGGMKGLVKVDGRMEREMERAKKEKERKEVREEREEARRERGRRVGGVGLGISLGWGIGMGMGR